MFNPVYPRVQIIEEVIYGLAVLVVVAMLYIMLMPLSEWLAAYSLTSCTVCPDTSYTAMSEMYRLWPLFTVGVVFLFVIIRAVRQRNDPTSYSV